MDKKFFLAKIQKNRHLSKSAEKVPEMYFFDNISRLSHLRLLSEYFWKLGKWKLIFSDIFVLGFICFIKEGVHSVVTCFCFKFEIFHYSKLKKKSTLLRKIKGGHYFTGAKLTGH